MFENMTPEQITKLKGLVTEADNSMIRADAEKELQKEIASRAKDELGIETKHFRKLASIVHKDNADEELATLEEISSMAEALNNGD